MLRKFSLVFIIFTIFPVFGISQSRVQKNRSKFRKMVEDQHKSDVERKEALLRKMRLFITDINGLLKKTDSKTRIDNPIDIDKITDIDDKKHKKSFNEKIKRVYAYVNDDSVNIRTAASLKNEVVGKGRFAEKVEVVSQTNYRVRIGSMNSRWVLIRRENDDEGWIYGYFLSEKRPERKTKPAEKKKEAEKISRRGFMVPARGRRSSNFGYRVDPVTKRRKSFHRGIDIAAPSGTPIKAAADGKVVRSGWSGGYGNLVVIRHEKDLATYYAHQSRRLVRVGQRVRRGKLIGRVGSTGKSTGPHLHFEVRRGRTAMNPNQFIR